MKRRLRSVAVALAGTILMTAFALVMALVRVVLLGGGRRFCAEVLGLALSRAILFMMGVKVVVRSGGGDSLGAPLDPRTIRGEQQTIYTLNHTSALDIFIAMSMGLPRARYFMKRAAWLMPPAGLIAWAVGTFFTPPQTKPAARVRCFQKAERKLRETSDSVLLSPEGTRHLGGKIGPFNKGTFHLATNLKAAIVPLFFDIPAEIDPGKGLLTAPGTVVVYMLPAIETVNWTLADLEANKEAVRCVYTTFKQALVRSTELREAA